MPAVLRAHLHLVLTDNTFQHAAAERSGSLLLPAFRCRAINLFQRRDSQRGVIDQLLRQFARAIHQFALADNAVHDFLNAALLRRSFVCRSLPFR